MTSSPPDGVIHDIGYRRYAGARLGVRSIAASLWRTGLLHAYGIGRSGKAKVLPMALLAMMLIPALISVALMATIGIEDFISYSAYPTTAQLLIVIFVAAQAPVLFSRDLRSGAIVLYLARPLAPVGFALVRWASLSVAILILVLTPVLLIYLGAIGTEADVAQETGEFAAAAVGIVLLAALLAAISGLVSAFTPRRGLAIGAIIVALLVSSGVVSAVQGVAVAEGNDAVAQWAGLFSPFTLIDGVQAALLDGQISSLAGPESTAMGWVYLAVALATIVLALALLVQRYHQQGRR